MLNKTILQGRLVADPELRQTPGGIAVVTIRIACERDFVDRNGSRQADFVNLVAWRQTAEFICRYFTKGSMILAEGRIQTRDHTDGSGIRRYVTEVIAEHVYFSASRRESGSGTGAARQPQVPQQASSPQNACQQMEFTEMDNDGELPF